MDEVVRLGLPVLAEPQAQSQLPLGDWSNAAFGNDLSMKDLLWLNDVMLAQPQDQTRLPVADVQHAFDQQPVCEAIVPPEPRGQTPGVAVNGVALRLPLLKLPSQDQSAMASGYHTRKILNEVSAGTNLMATSKSAVCVTESNEAQGKRRKSRTPRADKVHECKPCKKFFNSAKDLHRHLRSTRAHNAPPVAYCTCGKSVTRKDAMRSHRSYCRGTTLEPEAAQAAGLVGN
jgi:hypothetical protein